MELKRTITSIFMIPVLKIGKEKLMANGFINAYIDDVKKKIDYENVVYLLFKPKSMAKFKQFLDDEYERTKNVIDDYDYENGYVVVVYKLPSKYKKDFAIVKQGKYSKTSEEFQELFPKVVKLVSDGQSRDEISLQFRIFNKTKDLKEFWGEKLDTYFDDDMEVWHAFEEENEILDIDKIKTYV